MNMLKIHRFFSKFAQIKEVGLHQQAKKHLEILKQEGNYKPFLRSKVLNAYTHLYSELKRKIDLNSIKVESLPEIQSSTSHLPKLIPHLDTKATFTLMRTLSRLRIKDESIWSEIESHVCKSISKELNWQLTMELIKIYSKLDRKSPELWNNLESHILKVLCPRHDMSGQAVALILSTYGKMENPNRTLIEALEQQTLRSIVQMDGTDIAKALYTFERCQVGSTELFNTINAQCKLSKGTMDAHCLVLCLATFARLGKGTNDMYEDLEDSLKSCVSQLTLQNISTLIFAYAKHKPYQVQQGKRRSMIVNLEKYLAKHFNKLKNNPGKDPDLTVMNIYWGLTVGEIEIHPKLLGELSEYSQQLNNKHRFAWMKDVIAF